MMNHNLACNHPEREKCLHNNATDDLTCDFCKWGSEKPDLFQKEKSEENHEEEWNERDSKWGGYPPREEDEYENDPNTELERRGYD